MKHTNDELQMLTTNWAKRTGIADNGKATTQLLKTMSELGELADNLIKGKDIKDDIGDVIVTLNNVAILCGTTINECWNHAYNDIKDRVGYLTPEGNFIKSSDPAYSLWVNNENILVDRYRIDTNLFGHDLWIEFKDGYIHEATVNNNMLPRLMPIIQKLENHTLTKAECLEEL